MKSSSTALTSGAPFANNPTFQPNESANDSTSDQTLGQTSLVVSNAVSSAAPNSMIGSTTETIPAAGKMALRFLKKISAGSLRLATPGGQIFTFGNPTQTGDQAHHAQIQLSNWNLCSAVLKSGDIGFAEGYMDGDWKTDDLAELLKLIIANRNQLENVVYGSWWGQLTYRVRHWFNRNTKAQAKKNIHAHYDLGNEFYKLWLDQSMTYSSALFAGKLSLTLEQAQQAKYDRALSELQLQRPSNILEVGCGWGGLAQTATQAGHQITGLTLSTEQLEWAQKRLQVLGKEKQAQFLLQDYRDTDGQFDGIVSIEMFEAVGEQYWQSYFECLQRNLRPGARACVQSITIADELFERYRTSTDFIQQYIFPGGMLPSPSKFKALATAHGFIVVKAFAFGHDYAHTLKLWRQDFMQRLDEVKQLGFDDRFNKTWEFYLAYCEAAFAKNNTDVMQFTLHKPVVNK
jgi:cyclopropane-fatty-acyl-phospholipid synthase